MYTAILVDDEYWALKGIALTFPWAEFGFELIYQTSDPQEALRQAVINQPDVIFTDIRMPSMSGIELMEKLRELGVSSLFVVLSGYADFEYARSSIRLNVFDYLLKPLDSGAARKLLEGLCAKLDSLGINREGTSLTEEEQDQFKLKVNNPQFILLLEHINKHFGDMLHITKLSKKFFINTSYCCKLFELNFGKNFSDYVKEIRMKKAIEMLDMGISVKEVAAKAGYTDYYYFMKAFKKYYGVTPTEYKKSGI